MDQQPLLDTFDHVVVLMLENRSFDNILGYLYQDGVPPGKNFEGVSGKNLTNPDENGNPVPVSSAPTSMNLIPIRARYSNT